MKKLIATLITEVHNSSKDEVIIPFRFSIATGSVLSNYLCVVNTRPQLSFCQKNSECDGVVITMHRSMFDNLSNNTLGFLLAHEIAHAAHLFDISDDGNIKSSKWDRFVKMKLLVAIISKLLMFRRKRLIRKGIVMRQEIEADSFAAKFFNPVEALTEIRDNVSSPIAKMELDNRINIQVKLAKESDVA